MGPSDDDGYWAGGPGGWFGPSWGAPVCDPDGHLPTPVGQSCTDCHQPIKVNDQGLVIPCIYAPGQVRLTAVHIDCFRRGLGVEPEGTDG